jgi:antigen flippase
MTVSPDAQEQGQTYLQILKSTLLIGGSSVINVAFAIVRNKAIAVMLGPEGIGLLSLYSSIVDIAQALAGLGVQSSGVRQIAESVGTGDAERIARTATVLSRVSLVLALAGGLLLALLALPVAHLTFGDYQHAGGVALLSLALVLRVISGGQIALLQGLRNISSLAMVGVLGALASTVIIVPLIYLLGTQAIVPSIVAVAAATLLVSWWYSRSIRPATVDMPMHEFGKETAGLLKLGFVFMISSFLTVGVAYAIRIIVLRHEGIAAAGLYQAAWSIGGLYAGFILQAMGTDFYPRLTAISQDNAACNRLVNEQTQVSILLAGPGVIATLTFAPLVMHLFYSSEFQAATDLLRWICLGMMLRIIAWPIGFIVLAKGEQAIYFWTDLAAAVVHLGLAWLLSARFGVTGAGAAFFGLYVWHSVLIYVIVSRLSGFRWSATNKRLGLIFLGTSALVFCATQTLPLWPATVLGCVAVLASGINSLKMLVGLVPAASLPGPVRGLMSRFS